MNLNFNQLAMIQKGKEAISRFRANHPKFPAFLEAVKKNALTEGTVIEISVTAPDGTHYESNLKLNQEDIELLDMIQNLNAGK